MEEPDRLFERKKCQTSKRVVGFENICLINFQKKLLPQCPIGFYEVKIVHDAMRRGPAMERNQPCGRKTSLPAKSSAGFSGILESTGYEISDANVVNIVQ